MAEMQAPLFPIATPESQGVSSRAVLDMLHAWQSHQLEIHSFMVIRHGHRLASGWWQPYAEEKTHMMFSVSKSFTSAAIGIAESEGLLRRTDTVASFFPEECPADASEWTLTMTLHHLLTMSTGQSREPDIHASGDKNWARVFFAHPPAEAPGTTFRYNSLATYMLAAVLQKVTGQFLTDYLTPRLFEPMGIVPPLWDACPRGIACGGWGMHLTTEVLAAFGELYRNHGQWHGQRLVPAEWVMASSARQIASHTGENSDWTQGYGYQFWLCKHGGFRADGAFGQFALILPEHHLVVAITSGEYRTFRLLDAVWEHLLPGLHDTALPEDPEAQSLLAETCQRLALDETCPGSATGPRALAHGKTYTLEHNDAGISQIALHFNDDAFVLTQTGKDGQCDVLTGGYGTPLPVTLHTFFGVAPATLCGGWTGETVFTLKLRYLSGPFRETFELNFDTPDTLRLTSRSNVTFGPDERPVISGKRI